jgi:hypothetical protein
MDSNAGALVGFFGFFMLAAAVIVGFRSLWICVRERDFRSSTARTGKICAGIVLPYLVALMLVAALTPRTIVRAGDGYCWDLWCAGIEQVSGEPQGTNVLYTARVRLFSDANRVSTWRQKDFLSVVDDQGRRFPVFQDLAAVPESIPMAPGASVETSLRFLVPANARKLYLIGEQRAMPWVYMYFGSDLNPLHPRTLLQIL